MVVTAETASVFVTAEICRQEDFADVVSQTSDPDCEFAAPPAFRILLKARR
jgi:hypothetical protein